MSAADRIYPKFVSGLGSVGLGLTLAYFVGVVLVFVPGWPGWSRLFLLWGPPLALVPGVALIAHLYLRTHLGRWWLRRRNYERAIEYTEARLEPNLLRSRKETLYHRLYLGRARIAVGAYEEAVDALLEEYAVPETGREVAKLRRWQLEAALRLEDADGVEEAFEAGIEAGPAEATRAALKGGRAEWAVLEGSSEAYQTHVERARAVDDASPRVELARVFGAVRFGRDAEDFERGVEALESCRETAVREIPGREAEIDAVHSQLAERLGRTQEARRLLERARAAPADERSRRRVDHVAAQVEFEEERDGSDDS